MKNKKPILLIFSTAIISGVSIFLNQFGVQGIDSNIFAFSKNLMVALFLLSLIIGLNKFKEFSKLKKEEWLKLVLIGLIGGSIPFLLFFRGLQATTGTSASLIHKTMFLFITVLAIIFLKEKLDRKVIIASLLLVIGNYLFLKPTWNINQGDFLILMATMFWATENVISKHTLKKLSGNIVAFGRMFFGSIFILVYLFFTDKLFLIRTLRISQITWVVVTSGMLFLYVFTWYNGLKKVPVSLASAVLLLGSPITTLLNLTTGETLTTSSALGTLLILSGVVLFINSSPKYNFSALFEKWMSKKEH